MSKYTYVTSGTCSRKIEFELTGDGRITGLHFEGGCSGNLQGLSRLCEGMPAEEAAKRLAGIKCGMKPTSCPDQLSKAINKALKR